MTTVGPDTRPAVVPAIDLDPRARILGTLVFSVAGVVAPDPLGKGVVVLAILLCWAIARVPLGALAIALPTLAAFTVSTVVLHLVVAPPPGSSPTRIGPLAVSAAGLPVAAAASLQIAAVVLALTLLIRSTSPVVLAEGLELLLKPLSRIGAPIHEAGMMFSIALRFIPVLAVEYQRIQLAQVSRGGLRRRGVVGRVRGVLPVLIPVFIATIVRARDLSEAMDSRGYRGDVGRTAIRLHRIRPRDVLALVGVLLVAFTALVV